MSNTWGLGTDTTGFSSTIQNAISRLVIKTLRENLTFTTVPQIFVPAQMVSQHGSNGVMVFSEYPDLPAGDTDTLTEGTPPTAKKLGIDTNSFTAVQIGDYVKVTDLAAQESPHPLPQIATDKVANQAARSMNAIVGKALVATSNIEYAGTGNAARLDLSAGDVLTAALVKRAKTSLAKSNVERINGFYVAFATPEVLLDLMSDTDVGGWIDAARYAGSQDLYKGELGTFAGVRFVETNDAVLKHAAGAGDSTDVFSTLFCGANSVAFGDTGTLRVQSTGFTPDKADPLGQLATFGWKAFVGATVLAFKESTDGSGTNGSAIDRVLSVESTSNY